MDCRTPLLTGATSLVSATRQRPAGPPVDPLAYHNRSSWPVALLRGIMAAARGCQRITAYAPISQPFARDHPRTRMHQGAACQAVLLAYPLGFVHSALRAPLRGIEKRGVGEEGVERDSLRSGHAI